MKNRTVRLLKDFLYGFWSAALLMGCAVLCVAGMTVAERNTTAVGFGQSYSRVFWVDQQEKTLGLFGNDYPYDSVYDWWHQARDS